MANNRKLNASEDLQYFSGFVGSFQRWSATYASLIVVAMLGVAAIIAFLPIMSAPGIPSFQHDWMWPTSHDNIQGWLDSLSSGWSWLGVGHRQVYPFALFFYVLSMHLALLVGAKAALVLFGVACLASAGIGMARLVRLIGVLNPMAVFASGLLYETSPVVFNKIGAGHCFYWLAYALLPWIVYVIAATVRQPWFVCVRSAAILTILMAFSWSQAQFVILDGFVVICCLIFVRDVRVYAISLVSITMALAIHSYSIVTLLHPPADPTFSFQGATLAGVGSESVSFWNALAQTGYPPGYFRTIVESQQGWWWITWLLRALTIFGFAGLLSGYIVKRFNRQIVSCSIALTAIGVVLVMGINPPFGGMIRHLFEVFPPMALLKELYHAMCLVSFGAAVGVGIGTDAAIGCLTSWRRYFVLALVPTAATLACSLPVLLGLFSQAFVLTDGAALDQHLQQTADGDRSHNYRVLLAPFTPPITLAGAQNGGGNDAESVRPFGSLALFEGAPPAPLAYAESQLIFGRPRGGLALDEFGVRYIVVRKDFQSHVVALAGLPTTFNTLYDTNAFIARTLRLGQFGLADNTDAIQTFRQRGRQSLFLASNAIYEVPDDQSAALNAIEAAGYHDRIPVFMYQSDVPASWTTAPHRGGVPINRDFSSTLQLSSRARAEDAVTIEKGGLGFNPTQGWSPGQYVYFWNSWLSSAPTESIFTLKGGVLPVRSAPSLSEGRLLVYAATNSRQPKYVDIRTPNASYPLLSDDLFVNLRPLPGAPEQRFHWLISDIIHKKLIHASLLFDIPVGGLAVNKLYFVKTAKELQPQFATPGREIPALRPATVQITSAGINAFEIAPRGEGRSCAVALLTSYDSSWRARIGKVVFPHFKALGWANGFLVPCNGARIAVSYDSAFFSTAIRRGWAGLVAAVGVAVLSQILIGLFAGAGRRRRASLEMQSDSQISN